MNASTETLVNTARQMWLADEHEAALIEFRKAMHSAPNDMRLAVEVASYLGMRFEIDEASSILKQCEDELAHHANGLFHVGLAYDRAFRSDDALRCFQNVVSQDTNHDQAWLRIAEWFDRRGQLDEAMDSLRHCKQESAEVQLAKAKLQARQGENAKAEALLQQLTSRDGVTDETRTQAWYALAGVYDREGRAKLAFEAATAAKSIQRQTAISHLRQAQKLARLEANFVATVTDDHYQRWSLDAHHPPVALLTGSPRSGTTLMARTLGNHASIHLVDEINAYSTYVHKEMMRGLKGDNAGDALDAISDRHLTACRSRYLRWMFAASNANEDARILLDKNPSTTFLIPAFRRLFPGATIVMAIRDPRDVIVSCYLQYFPLNPVSAMFSRLDLTVMRCRAEMEAWVRLRDKMTQPWCELRYEKLASGNLKVLKPVLEALRVDWQDELTNFQPHLLESPVRSPTYVQLFEPIHTKSIGRWQGYEEQLKPYAEQLEPVSRALGYR